MSTLQGGIMRRVYAIWFLRQITSVQAVKAYILAFSLWQLFTRISILSVIHNAPSMTNVGANITFFGSALSNTERAIQFALIAAVICAVWFFRDFLRARVSTEKSFGLRR